MNATQLRSDPAPPRIFTLLLVAFLNSLAAPADAAPALNTTNVISHLTREIERSPRHAELFLKRGEIFRAAKNWDAALADFQQAAALDPALASVDLATAQVLLDANWPLAGKVAIDRFLRRQPTHTDGLVTRARANLKLNQPQAAADDLAQAIATSANPGPELFLERAFALTTVGPHRSEEALRAIEDGLRRHGSLLTLQLYAIDLEARAKRFDDALRRLDKVAAQSAHAEAWLARRGEILMLAGREPEARQAFTQALATVRALPPARRNSPGINELEKRLSSLVETKPAPPRK